MSKSYVGMEDKICMVTGKRFTIGLIFDKKMRDKLDTHNVTGWGISPEVQEKFDDNFVALVAIDETKSTMKNGRIQPEDAWRTGEIVYLRRPAFIDIFDTPDVKEFTFVDQEVLEFLKALPKNEE